MRFLTPACLAFVALSVGTSFAQDTEEPLLRKLGPGLFLKSSEMAPAPQTKAIGQKLGGEIKRLSNSVVTVHGRAIKVNVITAANEASAKAIEQSLLKIKPYPFCLRKDLMVIEYVGTDIDAALATKTSYELGIRPRPKSVRYRVTAELGAVEKADYMSCNPLFNHFIALGSSPNEDTKRQIRELTPKFTFGRQVVLRNPAMGGENAVYQFQPGASESKASGSTAKYSFAALPQREGVPYVTATMEISVNDTGMLPSQEQPGKELVSATMFWPADEARVKKLAEIITGGKATNEAKANAILEWLAPSKNIKYSGQTGSRWGTIKVLEQKFGHCLDFSDAFVTLCRAAGVPSRQVGGWLY